MEAAASRPGRPRRLMGADEINKLTQIVNKYRVLSCPTVPVESEDLEAIMVNVTLVKFTKNGKNNNTEERYVFLQARARKQ